MKSDTVILGGGITGLSTAYHLKNKKFIILEKENVVGGLCRSVTNKNGFTYDYTGHLLHIKSDYVKNLVKKLLRNNLTLKVRNSWIFSQNVFTRYPFQANLFGLPQKIIDECIEGFIEAKLSNSQFSILNSQFSFHNWCLRTFGKGISKYFMIPYNQKLWQRNLKELTTDWLGNYVPQPTLQEVITGAFTDTKNGGKYGYNVTFFYPKEGGIQSLINQFIQEISCANIITSVKIISINLIAKTVKTNLGNFQYNKLVSTIPVPELIKLIKNPSQRVISACHKLRWTSVLDINIGVKRKNISDKHWIYFPEKKFSFYRVGFFNNFSESLCSKNTSSMYIEISYRNRKINKSKIVQQVIFDLQTAKIIKPTDKIISKCILDIPYAYVHYDKNRNKAVETIQRYLQKNSIFSIGRFGGWKYSTMEDAILDGKSVAEKTT
ncbi:MAG: FAD-dependent oxidoreductase [Elusimicrobiota bacterium]